MKRQQGFTLVELLATLVLTMFLMVGVIDVFQSNMRSGRFLDNAAGMEVNGHYALKKIAEDIRMAGYTGCTAYDTDDRYNKHGDKFYQVNFENSANASGYKTMLKQGIIGYEAAGTAPAQAIAPVDSSTANTDVSPFGFSTYGAISTSDIVQVFSVSSGPAIEVTDIAADSASASINVTIAATKVFSAGDRAYLSNCERSSVMQICSVVDNADDSVLTVSNDCDNNINLADENDGGIVSDARIGTQVVRVREAIYFIAKRDAAVATVPSLWRDDGNGAVELVEGVESLQLLYGENTDNADGRKSADTYVTATDVGNWNDVVSVQISLLIQSHEDFVTDNGYSYEFNGQNVDATDRRYRRAFSTTVALRNRALYGF